jgi:hypothetical protein
LFLEDPWREATVSSDYHPRSSTQNQPIHVLESGFHCSDLITRFNIAPDIKAVQDDAVATFSQWISEFVPGQNARRSIDQVMPQVETRDDGNSTIPSVDTAPPTVDLGTVNSGVVTPQTGATPAHVGRKGAWDVDPVVVN